MQIGDRVICIKESTRPNPLTIKGEHYTIIDIQKDGRQNDSLFFEGVNNGSEYNTGGYDYYGFDYKRFRKLETYKLKENQVQFNIIEEKEELMIKELC